MSKNLKNNYLDLLTIGSIEDDPHVETGNLEKEIAYLQEIYECSKDDIKFVYVAAVGETVIYVNKAFVGYLDNYFINEMDRHNNAKKG